MAKVVVKFDKKTGDFEVEVNGIPGVRCKDITELLTQGLEVVEEQETEEMYISELPDYIENM